MRPAALAAGFAAFALTAPSAASASSEEPLLTLCIERTPRDLAAAAVLDGWMNAIRIEVAPPPCAPPRESHFVGRFEMRGRTVYFRLAGASGPALGRALPWLDGPDEPLASLDAAGWLGEFSVVLEALLAEHHLALEWAEILEAELAGAGGPPGAALSTKAGAAQGSGAARGGTTGAVRGGASASQTRGVGGGTRAGKAGAAPKSAGASTGVRGGSASGSARPQAPTASAGEPVDGDRGATPAGGDAGSPAATSGQQATASVEQDDLGEGATAGETERAPGNPAAPGNDATVAAVVDGPRLPGIEEEARAAALRIAAEREARRNAIDFRTPDADPLALALLAGGALRLRSPDVAAPEISIGFEVGSFYARGAWQPQVRWQLADLPIGLEALGTEAGMHAPLLSGRIWSIRGYAGVAVERLVLRPLYREGAADQVDWDAGPTAGANLAWRFGPDLHVGLAGGLHWMPTARLTHVGALGPSARVNAFGGRLGMDLSWRR